MTDLRVRSHAVPIAGLTRLVRPGAVLASATICLAGASFASTAPVPAIVLAMLAVSCAVAAANVCNDIIDIEADRVNVPDRPLPSGTVSVPVAIVSSSVLAMVAVLVSLPLGLPHTLTVAVVLGASAWYSLRLKRIIIVGPLVVGLLLAAALVFGATLGSSATSLVAIGAVEIAVFTLGRETLKGVRDIDGDRRTGVRTVANVWGPKTAVATFATCCAAVIVASGASGSMIHFGVMTFLVGLPGIVGSIVWWTSDRDLTAWAISGSAWLWVTGLAGIALL